MTCTFYRALLYNTNTSFLKTQVDFSFKVYELMGLTKPRVHNTVFITCGLFVEDEDGESTQCKERRKVHAG